MTINQAWNYVVARESQGIKTAIGDGGRAAGLGQMWWIFRKDYWPDWAWDMLEQADREAFENCVKRHPEAAAQGLRYFYENVYNPHASAPEFPTEPIV